MVAGGLRLVVRIGWFVFGTLRVEKCYIRYKTKFLIFMYGSVADCRV